MKKDERADVLKILSRSSLTEGMGESEIAELLASSQVRLRRYDKGEMIFSEGDKPQSLYILIAGEVHICKDMFSGRRIFLSEIDAPGDMFGEVYLMLGMEYDLYVECVRSAEVLEIGSTLFSLADGGELSRAVFLVQRNMTRIFARKAYSMNHKLKILGSGTLREKIVRYLYTILDAEKKVMLTVNREFLANYLAVTRPALSREIGAMVKEGILSVEGKMIRVLDMERFEEYL